MNTDTIMNYIEGYGYFIIFLFLFFGIVGIPAPEESLIFLIGVLIAQQRLAADKAILSCVSGALIGMLLAYLGGRYVGEPLIQRFGKYVGITRERWHKVEEKYKRNINKTILFGFYMPGVRQISPYFAGIAKVPFWRFSLLSLLGTILWLAPFLVIGYYLGQTFDINPDYVPYIGVLFLLLFIVFVLVKWLRGRREKKNKRNES